MGYQIKTDELDFDLIKSNIKAFFQSQGVFTDYDYEGSTLSALMDVLAYQAMYQSHYTHLAVNEMFIDSASKMSSVVSLAKTIGYTPRSAKSSRSNLTIVVSGVPGNPTTLTLPKGTEFSATNGNGEYSFYLLTDYTATNNSGSFTFSGVEVVEGKMVSTTYVVSSGAKYVIPNNNVDTSSISVTVQESSSSSNSSKYLPVEDILTVSGTDKVYFIKQREDLFYEIYFGNDVIGKALSLGNIVKIDYVVSSGASANLCEQFVYVSGFRSDVSYSITNSVSFGGSDPESIESIKFNAPRAFQTQKRIVTSEDFVDVLKSKFPEIETISVWGGQDHFPPTYGKVFIAAKPFNRDAFLDTEKESMYLYLKNGRNLPTIEPVFIDPDYLRIQILCNVYYDKSIAKVTSGELASTVNSVIQSYANNLNSFGSSFRFSKLSQLIDDSSNAIISNITSIKLRKEINPIFGVTSKYTIKLENPIYQDKDTGGTVWSTRFYLGEQSDRCYFKDNGSGGIDMYLENTAGVARYYKPIGTVNYSTGTIEISDILVRGLYDPTIEVMCTPLSNDVIPVRQTLISIPTDLITVNTIADTEMTSGVKQQHIFSASR